MNSNMAKPEKFGHLPLVYHFKVPLIKLFHIGAKNKAHIRKTHTLLILLGFHLAYFRLFEPKLNLNQTNQHLHSYNALLIFLKYCNIERSCFF